MPTALDNGQRSTRKLLAAVVSRVLYALHGGDQADALMSDEKPPACLGCGRPVYESQQFFNLLRRGGGYVVAAGKRMVETRPERESRDALTFIGVFHQACVKKTSKRLKAGKVTFPDPPSFVTHADLLAAVRPPSRAPTGDGA